MISSIRIEGFRGFKQFEMSGLGQINLLVGKNNCGKTSILEALYLLTTKGDLSSLGQLLWRRGERSAEINPRGQPDLDVTHLFTGHEIHVGSTFTLTARNQTPERAIAFVIDEMNEKERTELARGDPNVSKLVLRIKGSPVNRRIPLTLTFGVSGDILDPVRRLRRLNATSEQPNAQFITTESVDGGQLVALWDKIALTPLEDMVLGALRCLDPEIERIAAQAGAPYWGGRSGFIIKHKQYELPIPIGSMGDGSWRMLGMAISITQCRDGVLLVDEIDTGLHHTVMADMWRLILSAATRFNVQVFATTHSSDCVKSLASAHGSVSYLTEIERDKPVVALHNIEFGQARATQYTPDELRMADEHAIDVR
jgi:hypothetical protein